MGRWLVCLVAACVFAGSAQAAPRVEYGFAVVAPRSVNSPSAWALETIARGNHESCARTGTGFFFPLDPGVSPPDTCQRAYAQVDDPEHPPPTVVQPTWVARLGSLDLAVLDSSGANDSSGENADVYAALRLSQRSIDCRPL